MRVAWIGLGSMGTAMALSALRTGHAVAGYARRPVEHDAFRAAGGTVTDRVLDILPEAEILCVSLFSEAQVREVVIEGGVLDDIPPGAILAVHSTVSAAFMKDLASRRDDIKVLDAGFSGRAEEAALGGLILMVGGDIAALERARPVFAAYADHIAHLGDVGAGMALKVINNLAFAAHVAIAQDTLHLVEQNGLARDVAAEALLRGSANSTALAMLGRSEDPEAAMRFVQPYLEKDVPIALAGVGDVALGSLADATRRFVPQ